MSSKKKVVWGPKLDKEIEKLKKASVKNGNAFVLILTEDEKGTAQGTFLNHGVSLQHAMQIVLEHPLCYEAIKKVMVGSLLHQMAHEKFAEAKAKDSKAPVKKPVAKKKK